MDDFLNVGADDTNEQQQTGDAVVVNQTTTDDFAFMTEENPYDQIGAGDDAQNAEPKPKQETDDPFASMIEPQTDTTDALLLGGASDEINDLKQDELTGTEQKEKSEDEPTFLSVWQEERKLELEKRKNKEKDQQKLSYEEAQIELEKFETDRAKRIENKKKENRDKEQDLRDDLNAVFKHGTIWEQVGKMVNLNETMAQLPKHEIERFRDLLIHLRNAKQ